MKTVTLSVATREAVSARVRAAFRGETPGAHISFASVDLLWRTLTKKRWEILRSMTGQGELAIREIARRVGRDVKAVHGDVTALIQAGILERTAGGVTFDYDTVHVDFMLTADAGPPKRLESPAHPLTTAPASPCSGVARPPPAT